MQGSGTKRNAQNVSNAHRAGSYTKVLDGRKRPIRGLWKRGDRYYARLSVEGDTGRRDVRRIPLVDPDTQESVQTVARAVAAMSRLKIQRSDNTLPVLSRTPKFADYAATYFEHFEKLKDKKRPATIEKERGTIRLWSESIGNLRLDKIRRFHINAFMAKRQDEGMSARTVNLDVIALNNVLNKAVQDDLIKTLPTERLKPLPTSQKKRSLISLPDIELLCAAANRISKNGQQFDDYIRLMAFTGARRDETLRLKWTDVDWAKQQLIIGSDGLAKNHESREVDFNTDLESHLRTMQSRRAPDSQWIFPSPQRGKRDEHAKTFRETLSMARNQADLPKLTFHDLRHFFISTAVMARIDFMTIAKWVGHKDGGVLIGKVYGHLADEHRRNMAKKLAFSAPDQS